MKRVAVIALMLSLILLLAGCYGGGLLFPELGDVRLVFVPDEELTGSTISYTVNGWFGGQNLVQNAGTTKNELTINKLKTGQWLFTVDAINMDGKSGKGSESVTVSHKQTSTVTIPVQLVPDN